VRVALASLFLLSLLLTSAACEAESALPEKRPADFAITLYHSGGMVPESWKIECSASECTYELNRRGSSKPASAKPTRLQLDRLYAVVRKYAVDRIRMTKHPILYDAASTGMSVTAAGRSYNASPDATHSVAKGDQARFQAIADALEALSDELGLAQKLPPEAPATEPIF
jgi:hypothetical protein